MNIPPAIRSAIKAAAAERGLSPYMLADQMGCSPTAIYHFFW